MAREVYAAESIEILYEESLRSGHRIIEKHSASSSSHPNFSAIFYARIELDIPLYASYLAI